MKELGTLALTRLLVARSGVPVIAAGGIRDGRGLERPWTLAQSRLSSARLLLFARRAAPTKPTARGLAGAAAEHTIMTRAISGRPARCLRNPFTEWGVGNVLTPPDYPIAYDAGQALNTAAKLAGEGGFGAQWAGQGAPLSRPMPAAELVALLHQEISS